MGRIKINYNICSNLMREISKYVNKLEREKTNLVNARKELTGVSNKYRQKGDILIILNLEIKKRENEITLLENFKRNFNEYISNVKLADRYLGKNSNL